MPARTRRTLLHSLLFAAVATAAAPGVFARFLVRGWANASESWSTRYLRVEVLEAQSNTPLPLFLTHQPFVGGEQGIAYRLRLTNVTNRRLLVVASVDGMNVLSGQPAATSQGGYILEPYGQVSIDGWRKSLNEVAQFVLTEPRSAYASQTGRPGNVGVIGFAVFEEAPAYEPPPTVFTPAAPSSSARDGISRDLGIGAAGTAEKSASRSAAAPSLGTGHGARQASPVRRGNFERASASPSAVLSLRYDSLQNLEDAGIAQRVRGERNRDPSPFPGDHGFVPDPPVRRW